MLDICLPSFIGSREPGLQLICHPRPIRHLSHHAGPELAGKVTLVIPLIPAYQTELGGRHERPHVDVEAAAG